MSLVRDFWFLIVRLSFPQGRTAQREECHAQRNVQAGKGGTANRQRVFQFETAHGHYKNCNRNGAGVNDELDTKTTIHYVFNAIVLLTLTL